MIVRGALIGMAGVLLAVVGGCRKGEPEASAPPPPAEVTYVTLVPKTIPVKYEWVAQTAASRTVEIRARVPGFLTQRPFEEGGLVDEGDLLFQIDQRNYQADLEIARARLAQAEASLSLAEVTLRRVKTAAAQGGTNQQEVDEKEAQRKEAEAAVRLAKGNLSNAELNLSYTTIVSPLRGRIGRSPVYEGAYVDASTNSLLATVDQSDPIYVEFSISEREILRWQQSVEAGIVHYEGTAVDVAPGATQEQIKAARRKAAQDAKVKVEIRLLDGTLYPHRGELNFVDVRVDTQTGTAQVRADVPNPDTALKPGQFVKVSLLGWERPNSIVVPKRAVMQQPTGQFVFVVGEGNKVQLKAITPGQWYGEEWAINSGLDAGERVIVDGVLKVQPGMTVNPTPIADAAKPQTSAADAGEAR